MRPIKRVKLRDERFATPDNKQLMARARMKQAVIKILTKLQAYHIYEKIKRNKYCVIGVDKFIDLYHNVPQNQTVYTREHNIQMIDDGLKSNALGSIQIDSIDSNKTESEVSEKEDLMSSSDEEEGFRTLSESQSNIDRVGSKSQAFR